MPTHILYADDIKSVPALLRANAATTFEDPRVEFSVKYDDGQRQVFRCDANKEAIENMASRIERRSKRGHSVYRAPTRPPSLKQSTPRARAKLAEALAKECDIENSLQVSML